MRNQAGFPILILIKWTEGVPYHTIATKSQTGVQINKSFHSIYVRDTNPPRPKYPAVLWPDEGKIRVLIGMLVLMLTSGCLQSHDPNWHVNGPLWTASDARTFRAEGPESHQRKRAAYLGELPVPPNPLPDVNDVSRATGSVSVGSVVDGILINGRSLPPTGPHHRAIPDQLSRGTHLGTDEMISLLLRAAEFYGKPRPGARLEIANISRRGGGRIRWSVSHKGGRDADILFPAVDSMGNPLEVGTMVEFNRYGRARTEDGQDLYLDVPGLLDVVRGLLDQEEIPVVYLFVSNPIRSKVINEARRQKLEPELIEKMKRIVRQPRGAKPHDDHLHLRIGCSNDDILDGCRNRKSNPAHTRIRQMRKRELIRLARKSSAETRIAAMHLLRWFGNNDTAVRGIMMRALRAKSSAVRLAAISSLIGQSGPAIDTAFARLASQRPPVAEIAAMLEVMEFRPSTKWTSTLRVLFSDARSIDTHLEATKQRTVQGEAIWLAGLSGDLSLVSHLIALLSESSDPNPVEEALVRITLNQPEENELPRMQAWRLATPDSLRTLRRQTRDRLYERGLIRRNGRAEPRACYAAIKDGTEQEKDVARRVLDQAYSRPCGNARWDRADLMYCWRRRLRLR